jgi:hypothetical protein
MELSGSRRARVYESRTAIHIHARVMPRRRRRRRRGATIDIVVRGVSMYLASTQRAA